MISPELEISLNLAISEASRRKHEYVTVEHILYALLHDKRACEAIENCGGHIKKMRDDLERFFKDELHTSILKEGHLPRPTLGFQRVIQRAAQQVHASGREKIYGTHILVAIFAEKESFAVYFFKKQGISQLDLMKFISHGISKEGIEQVHDEHETRHLPQGAEAESEAEEETETKETNRKSPLALYAVDLCEKAERGEIDPIIGRDEEIDRTMEILARRRKNNPLLVGEAGVGKTALAEGLALRIVKGQVPAALKGAKIYSLDMGALIAGSKFRGDFEQRLKDLLKAIKKIPKSILFIDEIHTLVGAGAVGSGAMDASNLLKPGLASGELRCIGSTTYKEFRNWFEKDHALARRFQKIDVLQPSVEDSIKILEGLKANYEEFHNVKYGKDAIKAAVMLSAKHITGKMLPDKAIDVIDETAASVNLKNVSGKRKTITVEMIQNTVAKMARIPPQKVSSSDRATLKQLETDLKSKVFGQDRAIESLATAIKLSRSGLGDEKGPIGSFLFAGPTGVGKTEVARVLAQSMGIELIRFDMSEYMERHAVSRLIGAPPGYVGFEQGGLLTEAIFKKPHSVLLLDEIEKAHPDMQNILLQVMDHGTLTDNNGKQVDFRNVIIVMTTNAGAAELTQQSIGFHRDLKEDKKGLSKAVKDMFSPEFRNRLTEIITFAPLDEEIVKMVAGKFLRELATQLLVKKVEVSYSDQLVAWLAHTGYDALYGARPIKRVIEDQIKKPLADALLFGQLKDGGKVMIDVEKEKVKFSF
jgi:ATP-dependent Clp protease ATP-binding subunit ClpA